MVSRQCAKHESNEDTTWAFSTACGFLWPNIDVPGIIKTYNKDPLMAPFHRPHTLALFW